MLNRHTNQSETAIEITAPLLQSHVINIPEEHPEEVAFQKTRQDLLRCIEILESKIKKEIFFTKTFKTATALVILFLISNPFRFAESKDPIDNFVDTISQDQDTHNATCGNLLNSYYNTDIAKKRWDSCDDLLKADHPANLQFCMDALKMICNKLDALIFQEFLAIPLLLILAGIRLFQYSNIVDSIRNISPAQDRIINSCALQYDVRFPENSNLEHKLQQFKLKFKECSDAHTNYSCRLAFLMGTRTRERTAPMHLLFHDKLSDPINLCRLIFESAGIQKANPPIDLPLRQTFLKAAHEKNEGTAAHSFFKQLKQIDNNNQEPRSVKEKITSHIFKYAGI